MFCSNQMCSIACLDDEFLNRTEKPDKEMTEYDLIHFDFLTIFVLTDHYLSIALQGDWKHSDRRYLDNVGNIRTTFCP